MCHEFQLFEFLNITVLIKNMTGFCVSKCYFSLKSHININFNNMFVMSSNGLPHILSLILTCLPWLSRDLS